ncbi:hypothetical protein [Jiella pelagia]|uniref:Uncharacterized protein n=1 Tax=Jiella pelagia TaxID=2986949 RepID=A0ABY7C6Y1_9HYPH|nr:hypothetical protein [Jiella pelagia]WAP70819.1 hypothetical protein OH818_12945 [Jiella pelagia]
MWVETHGTGGEALGDSAEMAPLKRLIDLRQAWKATLDETEKAKIWREALKIFAEEVYTIGIVSGVDQLVVVKDALENVPEKGVYNYDPGAFFGMYHPDTFHFACPAVDTAEKRP